MSIAERGTQAFKEGGVADLAPLVPLPGFIWRKPSDQMGGLAAGMAGPTGHHLAEVDIEHDAAEVEQQGVGGIGSEWQIHGSRLQNWTGSGNGRRPDGFRRTGYAKAGEEYREGSHENSGRNAGRRCRESRCWPGRPWPNRVPPDTVKLTRTRRRPKKLPRRRPNGPTRGLWATYRSRRGTDPWGIARGDGAAKADKAAASKPKAKSADTKPGSTAK